MRRVFAVVALVAAFAPSLSAAAPPRKPGAPPKILNFVRQTVKRGAAAAYGGLEAAIARGYHQAKIPLYWICLQSAKNPVEILYLNLYETADAPDRAAAMYRDRVPKHPDLVKLQQRLTALGDGGPTTTLTSRRDEFDYGGKDVDFATMGALRVTVFHVKPGHEGEFVDAAQTGRAVPWQMYEDTASPTFFIVAPMRSSGDRRDGGLPRALRRVKGIYVADKPVVYAVRPPMSHAPPEYAAANVRFRR